MDSRLGSFLARHRRAVLAGVGIVCIAIRLDALYPARPGLPRLDVLELSDFPFDPLGGTVADVPAAFRRLDGRRVQLIGEMWCPSTASDTVTQFELVDLTPKRPPRVQAFVACRARRPTTFRAGEVRVTGVLHVDVTRADGWVARVFALDAEHVMPTNQGQRRRAAASD